MYEIQEAVLLFFFMFNGSVVVIVLCSSGYRPVSVLEYFPVSNAFRNMYLQILFIGLYQRINGAMHS